MTKAFNKRITALEQAARRTGRAADWRDLLAGTPHDGPDWHALIRDPEAGRELLERVDAGAATAEDDAMLAALPALPTDNPDRRIDGADFLRLALKVEASI